MFHPLLLNGPVNELHEAEVEDITKEFIQKASIKTKGATGPLEFDADLGEELLNQWYLEITA